MDQLDKPVIKVNILYIKGVTFPHKNTIKNMRIGREYFSINRSNLIDFLPKIEKSIFEPSRGATGIKLKIAKTMFTKTIIDKREINSADINPVPPTNLMNNPKNKAIARFVKIPAEATHRVPNLLFVKFSGL